MSKDQNAGFIRDSALCVSGFITVYQYLCVFEQREGIRHLSSLRLQSSPPSSTDCNLDSGEKLRGTRCPLGLDVSDNTDRAGGQLP